MNTIARWRRFAGFTACAIGSLMAATPARAVTILDLHDAPGTHGVLRTDGVAWFQDQHDKHEPPHNKEFLTLQSNSSEIQGYNSDADPAFYFEVVENKTRRLTLSEVPLVAGFRVFYLDANQSQTQGIPDHIDLEELEIGTTNEANSHIGGSIADLRTLWTSAYSLDKLNADFTVRIEGEQGNAVSDMHVFIPDSLFTRFGDEATTFVYLFSRFTNNNAGSEHWNVDTAFAYQPPPSSGTIPEPATASLGLLSFGGMMLLRRRSATI